MVIDRDRLMRLYAPRLAQRAGALTGPQSSGGTVKDPDTLGGLLEVQVVGDVVEEKDGVEPGDMTALAPTEDDAAGADKRKGVPLGQDVPEEDRPDTQDPEPDDDEDDAPPIKKAKSKTQLVASDREVPADIAKMTTTTNTTNGYASWNPIVTIGGGRTVITGPATVERAAMWDRAPSSNPHMLWMQGRYVGAERPNRNGAFWATADLEVGKPSVAHGPLNWLHEEKHVIGTIADARLIPAGLAGQEQAAQTSDPHIVALAGIWKWVYPQEASVVQMASDAGVLAYSMECIAQEIQCVGDNGCGQTFAYMEVAAAGGGCDHLRSRASVRRLVSPTFLGGAVIVPPTRPGWADADASVMKEAASMAEQAFEHAGRPDISSTTWEQLMAGVIAFTRNTE